MAFLSKGDLPPMRSARDSKPTPRGRNGSVASVGSSRNSAYRSLWDTSGQEDEEEPVVHEAIEPECFAQLAGKPSALQDNIYSLLAASVVHDTVRLKTGTLGPTSRMLRCGSSALLVVFCIGIQIFLLQCLYLQFVRRAVVDIRKLYSNFEHHMYTQTEVYESDAVTVRGLPGFLMESQIKTFSQSELERICDIPLANWRFLAAILLVWTLVCYRNLRDGFRMFRRTVYATPTTDDIDEVLEQDYEAGSVLVKKLTKQLKFAISAVCVLPRMIIACALCVMGCRWLTATDNLQEILVNGVALEFVISLESILYAVVVSGRNKLMVDNTLFHNVLDTSMTTAEMWGSTLSVPMAMLWVFLYIFCLQGVLPDYRWDIAQRRGAAHRRSQAQGERCTLPPCRATRRRTSAAKSASSRAPRSAMKEFCTTSTPRRQPLRCSR